MTNYEQYVEVMQQLKTYSAVPVFALGEEINIKTPYIIVNSFGIGNEELGLDPKCRRDTKGYSIRVYGANRGRTEAVASDFIDDHFALRFAPSQAGLQLSFDRLENLGEITRLEDDLYESVITAWVSSIYHK